MRLISDSELAASAPASVDRAQRLAQHRATLFSGEAFFGETPATRHKPRTFKYRDSHRKMRRSYSRVLPCQRPQRAPRFPIFLSPYLPLTQSLAASYRRLPSAHNPRTPFHKPMNQLFLTTIEYTRKKPHR